MADKPAGQDTDPTGNDDGRIEQLEGTVQEHLTTITRLRGTQSSNDRTITELKKSAEGLTATVTDLTAQNQALSTDLGSLRTTNTELQTQLDTFGNLSTELEASKLQYGRLQIAAAKAGTSPVIAALIENNSLPTAEDNDAFAAALDSIAGSVQQITSTAATEILRGAKPAVTPQSVGDKTPDSLRKQANTLMLTKKTDAALVLMEEATALELQNLQAGG